MLRSDAKDANVHATYINKKTIKFNISKSLTIKMANAGGNVAVIE